MIPRNIYLYSGIKPWWDVFSRALNVSPLDGDQMPSVSMLSVVMGRLKIKKETFFEMTEYAMIRIRDKIRDEREAAIQRIKRK